MQTKTRAQGSPPFPHVKLGDTASFGQLTLLCKGPLLRVPSTAYCHCHWVAPCGLS